MKKLRKLSTIEAGMAYNHALQHGSTQVSTLLSLRTDAAPSQAAAAAQMLFRRHTALRCCIHEEDGELWFHEHGDHARIAVAQGRLPIGASIDAVLHDEMNAPLDAARSLWRLRLLQAEGGQVLHIVFTRHHAISDAHTTNRLLADLARLLDGQCGDLAAQTLTDGADALWADRPAPTALPAQPAYAFQAQPIAHHADASARPPRTGYRNIALSAEQTQQAHRYCKRYGMTINALFSALLAHAFCEEADLDGVQHFTATSLRNRLVPGERVDDVGCFIAVEGCALPTRHRALVETAARYQSALDASLAAYRPAKVRHADLKARLAMPAAQFGGIGITNMGVLDGAVSHRGLAPLRYLTVVSRNACNAAMVLHLYTLHGALHLTFTYPERVMDEAMVEAVALTMLRKLPVEEALTGERLAESVS